MRKIADCRLFPSESHCSLTISGTEDEVVRAAAEHAASVHSHEDTPELREQIRAAAQRVGGREQELTRLDPRQDVGHLHDVEPCHEPVEPGAAREHLAAREDGRAQHLTQRLRAGPWRRGGRVAGQRWTSVRSAGHASGGPGRCRKFT